MSSLDILNKLIGDFHREQNEATYRAAQANPKAYRNTTVMERGKSTGYHYYAGPKKRNKEIRYCYSKHRNCAGYFLSWVETWTREGKHSQCKRTAITGHRTKQDAIKHCAWRSKHPEWQA